MPRNQGKHSGRLLPITFCHQNLPLKTCLLSTSLKLSCTEKIWQKIDSNVATLDSVFRIQISIDLETFLHQHLIKVRALKYSFSNKLFVSLENVIMDTLQLAGQNLGRVFNFRRGHLHAAHLWCYLVKLPNLKLKTWHKQLLGSLPLDIALPRYTKVLSMKNHRHKIYRLVIG